MNEVKLWIKKLIRHSPDSFRMMRKETFWNSFAFDQHFEIPTNNRCVIGSLPKLISVSKKIEKRIKKENLKSE